jgi:hypothetical protein
MTTLPVQTKRRPDAGQWIAIGAVAAVLSAAAVMAVQWIALAIWPDAALFKPLESYARSALFTIVPALGATALFAWLAARRPDPASSFIRIAIVVLLLSFIPDYLLPVPFRTFLASSIAAFMHVVAAVVIVAVLVAGYRRYP